MPAPLSNGNANIAAHSSSTRSRIVQRATRAVAGLIIGLLAALTYSPSTGLRDAVAAERADEGSAHQHTRVRKKAAAPAETAFGREGDPRKVKRSVSVEASDAMRYFPDQIHVKKGQTLRFVVRNAGELPHEMVLGTMDELKKHAASMKKGGVVRHDGANVVRVEPGASGRLDWHFTKAGEFYFGCLVPGHFEAGMIGTVVVR